MLITFVLCFLCVAPSCNDGSCRFAHVIFGPHKARSWCKFCTSNWLQNWYFSRGFVSWSMWVITVLCGNEFINRTTYSRWRNQWIPVLLSEWFCRKWEWFEVSHCWYFPINYYFFILNNLFHYTSQVTLSSRSHCPTAGLNNIPSEQTFSVGTPVWHITYFPQDLGWAKKCSPCSGQGKHCSTLAS